MKCSSALGDIKGRPHKGIAMEICVPYVCFSCVLFTPRKRVCFFASPSFPDPVLHPIFSTTPPLHDTTTALPPQNTISNTTSTIASTPHGASMWCHGSDLCPRQDAGQGLWLQTSCQGKMFESPWGPKGTPWGPMGPRGVHGARFGGFASENAKHKSGFW